MRHTITAMPSGLVRANVWTEHGASSKTFQTASEARGWVVVASNRKPVRRGA
jgi:hypothetical protein